MVKDTNVNEHNGTFTDWRITLWGECINPDKQDLLPMPSETDDDDHDVISASPTFVSVHPGETATTALQANPSDHQDRPINSKPSATGESPTNIANITELPDVPDEPEDTSQNEHFLPHYFPTFGVSKRTQIWIYGAFGIIVLFCVGLGLYFFIVRRKRRKNQRDNYEFEVLDEDANLTGAGRGSSGRKPRRRAGELYDAFAGESDEEQLLSEDNDDEDDDEHGDARREDEKMYKDRSPVRGEQGNDDEKHGAELFEKQRKDLEGL